MRAIIVRLLHLTTIRRLGSYTGCAEKMPCLAWTLGQVMAAAESLELDRRGCRDGRRRTGGEGYIARYGQFLPPAPKIKRKDNHDGGQHRTEFIDVPGSPSGIARYRGKDCLHKKVVTGVQHGTGPQAARLQAHPGKDEASGYHQHRETGQSIPGCRSRIVVTPNQDGIMPNRPNNSANDRRAGETGSSR